jgi:sensor domain CHASE-containing protein
MFVKLQEKMSLILVISLIAVIALISIFVSVISLSSYTTLEHSYVAQDISQTAGKIREEALSLSTIVSDWGPWDDTYDYVQGDNPDFIETNIVPETYRNLRLNLIIIANSKGEVLYAGAYDLRNGKPAAVPPDMYPAIARNPILTDLNNCDGVQGLILLKDYPVLVASRPVVQPLSGQRRPGPTASSSNRLKTMISAWQSNWR